MFKEQLDRVIVFLQNTITSLINTKKSYAGELKQEELKNILTVEPALAFTFGEVDDVSNLTAVLNKLTELEVYPFDEKLKNISDIRLFKINEMVYQKDEYSTYKFASVFNSVQNLNCGIFIIADSNGEKTNFYMGVRSLDNKRTTKSLKDTLKNSLSGQFPGVKTVDLLDPEAEEFLENIKADNISSVSCVAKNKDDNFNENDKFLQGLEKLTIAMEGQKYTAIIPIIRDFLSLKPKERKWLFQRTARKPIF